MTFEQELRQNLTRQAAAHSDHLKDILKVQEKELEQTFERELNTKLIEERQTFHTEVANWIARLKGIESAVEGIALPTTNPSMKMLISFCERLFCSLTVLGEKI